MSKWQDEKAERNRRARTRLTKALPHVFPSAVLSHDLSRSFAPPMPRPLKYPELVGGGRSGAVVIPPCPASVSSREIDAITQAFQPFLIRLGIYRLWRAFHFHSSRLRNKTLLQGLRSVRATRKPMVSLRTELLEIVPRNAERKRAGLFVQDPFRRARRSQSPFVHAEPSFGAPV